MTAPRITKRTVDALQSTGREYTAWDDTVSGFGVGVRPTGAKSYVVVYRAKAGTAEFHRDILDRIVKPAVDTTKADKLTRLQVGKLHSSLSDTPFQANRVLAVIGSMYAFADRAGIMLEGNDQISGFGQPPYSA